jgi:hypothetical protein
MDPVQPVPWYTSRTMWAVIISGVLALLEFAGVKVGDFPIDKVLDLLVVIGLIYIGYRRVAPIPPKPLTQAQARVLTETAIQITGE